jgi:hypothetical protein
MVLLAVIGDSAARVLNSAGVVVGRKLTMNATSGPFRVACSLRSRKELDSDS